MIELENISVRYFSREQDSISNACFSLKTGQIIALVGPSGVGKSTLIALLSGALLGEGDKVARVTGKVSIDNSSPEKLRGAGVTSWVPQLPYLFDHLSILQNVLLPQLASSSDQSAIAIGESWLVQLGLSGYSRNRPRDLSVGQRSRVCLARAMITSPTYLYLDEPFANLDLVNRWIAYKAIFENRHGGNYTTIMSTHDVLEALLVADVILVMSNRDGATKFEVQPNTPVMKSEKDMLTATAIARSQAKRIESLVPYFSENSVT
jgi:ABC-type nitrate/sulfonate/bicarbonate transport system ATPase subunit